MVHGVKTGQPRKCLHAWGAKHGVVPKTMHSNTELEVLWAWKKPCESEIVFKPGPLKFKYMAGWTGRSVTTETVTNTRNKSVAAICVKDRMCALPGLCFC